MCTLVTSGQVASNTLRPRSAASSCTALETPWALKMTMTSSGISCSSSTNTAPRLRRSSTTNLLCTTSWRTWICGPNTSSARLTISIARSTPAQKPRGLASLICMLFLEYWDLDRTSGYSTSDSLHRNDFHLEGDVLARQRVIEVDFHGVVLDGLDHAGHFTTGGVAEDDQQAVLQLHVAELVTGHGLDVLRAAGTEAALGLDHEAALVTGLEPEQGLLEAGQQAAITDLEGGGCLAGGGVHHFAAGQLQGEVQGDFGVVANSDDVGHVFVSFCFGGDSLSPCSQPFTRPLFCRSRALGARAFAPGAALLQNQTALPNQASFPQPRPHHTPAYAAGAPPSARFGRNISAISITAPTVIALSALLNAGKYQLWCQCTRMKSTTWPCRSEERRVGKECRSSRYTYHDNSVNICTN